MKLSGKHTRLHIQIFVCRKWRDAGEHPSLWGKLQLYFEGPRDPEEGELHQLLTLRRFQSLQSLHLCCWDQTLHLLQTVLDCCPNLRKLALAFEFIPITDDELTGVAELLVKFEEVDLSEGFILKGKERVKEYLRAILTALKPGESSKLKMLRLHGSKSKLAADLVEARERGLKVKVKPVFEDSSDWTDSDDNDSIEDDDDNDLEIYD